MSQDAAAQTAPAAAWRDAPPPLRERVRPIQQRILAFPVTELAADEPFFDELSGDC